MTFTTLTFVLLLACTFAVHWRLETVRSRNALLVLASYVFYGWWDWRFCSLMLASTALDYLVGLLLATSERGRTRKLLLSASLVGNLGLLGFFKYYNFFVESWAEMMSSLGLHPSVSSLRIVLPVGISFYTFQTLSYAIDVYRRQLAACRDPIAFAAYVSFFPQLVAGPIERATRLLPQMQTLRTFDYAMAVDGCRLALWGFFKKMAIADNMAVVADRYYSNVGASSGPEMVLATVCFSFQIYADFSAYSDIAAGTAQLFGIRLMRNFAFPYFSQSVAEFWRRWHISLSTWFSDYLYVPMGGSRVGPLARARNVLVTFFVSGLWHGASWHFVAWGALNGVAVLPAAIWPPAAKLRKEDVPGGPGVLPSLRRILPIAATFAFTCIAWILFRSRNLPEAGLVLGRIVSGPWTPASVGAAVAPDEYLLLLIVGLLAVEWATRRHWHPLQLDSWPRVARWTVYTLLAWSTLCLAKANPAAFLYFQF